MKRTENIRNCDGEPCPVDSIREAMLTVSPNKQYLGILSPTTAATQGPTSNSRPTSSGND